MDWIGAVIGIVSVAGSSLLFGSSQPKVPVRREPKPRARFPRTDPHAWADQVEDGLVRLLWRTRILYFAVAALLIAFVIAALY